jgi:ferredoxin-like protein FixX
MTACATARPAATDIINSRIQIVADGDAFELAMCRQCGDPKCVTVCPAAALAKDAADGVIDWDGSKCVNCLLCTVGCAYRRHRLQRRGRPCRQVRHLRRRPGLRESLRPHGALKLPHHRAHLQRGRRLGDLFVPGLAGCQGCNTELIMRHTLRRIGPDTVLATPPGLHPGMGSVGYNGTDRHQGAGLPPAAHQHRLHAHRRQAPLQAPGPRGERRGAGRRRRRLRRRLPVALRGGRAQRADPVHGGGQRGLHEHRHAALELHALRRLDLDHAGGPGRAACPRRARRRTPRTCR